MSKMKDESFRNGCGHITLEDISCNLQLQWRRLVRYLPTFVASGVLEPFNGHILYYIHDANYCVTFWLHVFKSGAKIALLKMKDPFWYRPGEIIWLWEHRFLKNKKFKNTR